MHEDLLDKYSREAIRKGYIVTPFSAFDAADMQMKMAALRRTMAALHMSEFMQREVIDRLTYTRDYGIRQSINFMVISKNEAGKPLGIAHFIFSKSSGIMLMKEFVIAESKNTDKKAVLALLATGARDYMMDYNMFPKAVVISPSVKRGELGELNFMKELKMKFMALEPKAETSFTAQPAQPIKAGAGGGAVSVFPIKKGNRIADLRVIMVRNYGSSNFKMDGEDFSKFLKDIKDEDDLSLLLSVFQDSHFKITLKKINEMQTLIELLNAISGESAGLKHKV